MVQRKGGMRRKTRGKLKKSYRQKGKMSLKKYFQEFKEGDKVCLHAESAIQKGMYFPRFHGKSGIVQGKKGNCYNIAIKDFNSTKMLTVHPVHLKKL
jgi:large subunit ribosomal protein L21e